MNADSLCRMLMDEACNVNHRFVKCALSQCHVAWCAYHLESVRLCTIVERICTKFLGTSGIAKRGWGGSIFTWAPLMGYITSAAASWRLLVCTLLWRGDCGLQEELAATGTWGKSRFGAKGDSVGAGWGGGARELVPREGIYFCPILQKVLGQKKKLQDMQR